MRLLGAKTTSGPFEELLVSSLPDSRELNPVPTMDFAFPKTTVRFVRFEIIDFWGNGGGLQYFEVLSGKLQFVKKKIKKTN